MPKTLDSEARTPDSTSPVLIDAMPKLEPLVRSFGLMDGCKAYDEGMAQWLRKFQSNLGPFIEANKTGAGQ